MNQTRRPLAQLLAAVVNSQEQKGARVARLLHDETGQILSAVGLHLDVLRMDLEKEQPEASERIVEIQKILEKAVEQVRALSYEMNSEVVQRAGLGTALDRLAGRYREMADGVAIRMMFDSTAKLTGAPATSLYKIAECALDNAVKHSGGSQIEILVRRQKDGVALEVRDNGCGFDLQKALAEPAGLGLMLMGCYAEQGGLEFSVTSSEGASTIVRAFSAGLARNG